jgi:hypothetical protein
MCKALLSKEQLNGYLKKVPGLLPFEYPHWSSVGSHYPPKCIKREEETFDGFQTLGASSGLSWSWVKTLSMFKWDGVQLRAAHGGVGIF